METRCETTFHVRGGELSFVRGEEVLLGVVGAMCWRETTSYEHCVLRCVVGLSRDLTPPVTGRHMVYMVQ